VASASFTEYMQWRDARLYDPITNPCLAPRLTQCTHSPLHPCTLFSLVWRCIVYAALCALQVPRSMEHGPLAERTRRRLCHVTTLARRHQPSASVHARMWRKACLLASLRLSSLLSHCCELTRGVEAGSDSTRVLVAV
jgi:hypothetical protein